MEGTPSRPEGPGGYAAHRHEQLAAGVRAQRRRRQLLVTTIALCSFFAAPLFMRPWSWADVAAGLLFIIRLLATALSADLDVMPDWVENWRTGADGELATARQLERLPSTWVVRHDLDQVPGVKGNVDHLAVGPGGAYIIETKNWPKHIVTTNNGRLRRARALTLDRPNDEMGAIGQPKNAARHVHDAIKTIAPERFFVTPVLVIWAEEVPEPQLHRRGIVAGSTGRMAQEPTHRSFPQPDGKSPPLRCNPVTQSPALELYCATARSPAQERSPMALPR